MARGARRPRRRTVERYNRPAAVATDPPAGTRERLVTAARQLLEEGGYAAASVQAIADRSGLSAGALYRHFASKAELFVEVFRDTVKRDLAAVDEAAAAGTCLERFDAAITAHATRALRNRRLAWALLYEPVDPLVDAERLVYRRTYCRNMAGLLRQAVTAGEIPEQDVDLSAAALIGAVAESLVGPLSPVGGQVTAERNIVATLLRFCRRSIGAGEEAARRRVPRTRRTPARATASPGSPRVRKSVDLPAGEIPEKK